MNPQKKGRELVLMSYLRVNRSRLQLQIVTILKAEKMGYIFLKDFSLLYVPLVHKSSKKP